MSSSSPHHVKLEAVDWRRVLPVLRIFGLFRVAMQPTKLALAWLMVATLYVVGMALAWLLNPSGTTKVAGGSQEVAGTDLLGLWLERQFEALRSLIDAVIALDFGPETGRLLPALETLLITNPLQMWRDAPGYMVTMGALKFVVATLLGLAIARLAVLQLALRRTGGPGEAVSFVARKGFWALAAPLIPLAVVVGMALLLAAGGFVLFNVPVLDIVGGVAYGPLLLVGVGMALVLIALALAVHLLNASLAAEGTDAYDAVSRCFAYVSARPWQVVGYTLAALVYGAVTFLLVSAVVVLGVWLCDKALSAWVFGEYWAGGPETTLTSEDGRRSWSSHDRGTTFFASGVIGLWRRALFAVPPAYAVSFYICAAVQVYLLVRQSADGSDPSDCYDPRAEQAKAEERAAISSDQAVAEPGPDEPSGSDAA